MLSGFTEGWNTKVKNEEYDTQGEDVGLHTTVASSLPLHLTVIVANLIRLFICVSSIRSLIQAVDFRSFIAVGPYSLK